MTRHAAPPPQTSPSAARRTRRCAWRAPCWSRPGAGASGPSWWKGCAWWRAAAGGAGAPRLVLYAPPFGQREARERRLLLALRRMGCPVRPVTERVLAQVTDTVTPQGIVAVRAPPAGGRPAGRAAARGALRVLDERRERPWCWCWTGWPTRATPGRCCARRSGRGPRRCWPPGARSTSSPPRWCGPGPGPTFCSPCGRRWTGRRSPGGLPGRLPGAAGRAGAATPYWEVDWTRPTAVVVSSEAHGASARRRRAGRRGAGRRVAIPVQGVESLNVAVAGSVLLFEAVRQRAAPRRPRRRRAPAGHAPAPERDNPGGKGRIAR